jgi:hypothetical protein
MNLRVLGSIQMFEKLSAQEKQMMSQHFAVEKHAKVGHTIYPILHTTYSIPHTHYTTYYIPHTKYPIHTYQL